MLELGAPGLASSQIGKSFGMDGKPDHHTVKRLFRQLEEFEGQNVEIRTNKESSLGSALIVDRCRL
jgi:hypothetical protein